MIPIVDRASVALISGLGSAAARSFVLAGVAATSLALFRAKATSLRLFTWTAVLYTSLALPLLGAFLPPLQVSAPQFLQYQLATTKDDRGLVSITATRTRRATFTDEAAEGRSDRIFGSGKPIPLLEDRMSENKSSSVSPISGNTIVAAVYLTLTLFFLMRFLAGVLSASQLVTRSRPIADSRAIAKLALRAARLVPGLGACDRISVPITVGAFRPTILLPSDWQEWEPKKLDAVLAHELSHVERRDPLTQHATLLYRAIFWFNPLAWWLHRQIASLAEQASDEAALSDGADREHYARTLLDFFDNLRINSGRIRWQGVSMARPGQAEKRLERILGWKGNIPMTRKRSLTIMILFLAVPIIYLAASVHPAVGAAASGNSASQQPAPPPAPAAPPIGAVSAVAPIAGVPSTAPVAASAPSSPAAALAPEAPWSEFGHNHSFSSTSHGKGFSYHYGFDDEERFVIVSGKSDSFTMSGSTQDAHHVERLKKQIPGDFIWFQRDEKSYIIRDQATIDRARAFWAPQEELGRKQEELGKQQEELGKQQEELGAKMEQVKVNVPDMTAALDKLKAKLQKLGPTATMEQIGDLQSEIGELQSRLGEIQSQAGEQQGKLGELQGALGEKQGKLGEQQGELGRQQGELAEKASRQMKELLDEAIKNGTAKPEEEIVKSPSL